MYHMCLRLCNSLLLSRLVCLHGHVCQADLSVFTPLERLHRLQSVLFKHGLVLVPSVALGGQHLLTCKDGIGTCGKAKNLLGLTHGRSTGCDSDNGLWHADSGCGNGSEDRVEFNALSLRVVAERRTLDWNQGVDREGFWVCWKGRDSVDQADVVFWLLAETEDTSGANVDSGLSYV